jgi:hypothetical protein
MSESKEQTLALKPEGKRLDLTVGGCAVTLNFPPNAQAALMTEVKRMILSGHANAKMRI